MNEIKSSNDSRPTSKQTSKVDTPKLYNSKQQPPTRSFSTDANMNNPTNTISAIGTIHMSSMISSTGSMMKMSPRDTPKRKYFDSGDYELAKVGIINSASLGSLHPNPEELNSCSKSGSAHHLQVPLIIANNCSRDDLICRFSSMENESNLKQSSFSLDDLTE